MRNYILLFATRVDFVDVTQFPPPIVQQVTWAGETQFRATANANAGIATGAYTSPGIIEVGSITELGKLYAILDKLFLLELLAPTDGNSDFVLSAGRMQTLIDNMQSIDLGIDQSPRKKWARATPGKVTPREKPDLSGAGALITNFLALMDSLIAQAKKSGDKREQGILTDLLNKFNTGQLSITQILAQLEKLFIIR